MRLRENEIQSLLWWPSYFNNSVDWTIPSNFAMPTFARLVPSTRILLVIVCELNRVNTFLPYVFPEDLSTSQLRMTAVPRPSARNHRKWEGLGLMGKNSYWKLGSYVYNINDIKVQVQKRTLWEWRLRTNSNITDLSKHFDGKASVH